MTRSMSMMMRVCKLRITKGRQYNVSVERLTGTKLKRFGGSSGRIELLLINISSIWSNYYQIIPLCAIAKTLRKVAMIQIATACYTLQPTQH